MVSDIFVAVAARVYVAPTVPDVARGADVAMRGATTPPRPVCADTRVADVRGAICIVPARELRGDVVRVGATVRAAVSVFVRIVVVAVRDCVAARAFADTDVPSRTADNAGALANMPRIAPKIRIPFISGFDFSKNHKFVASRFFIFSPCKMIKFGLLFATPCGHMAELVDALVSGTSGATLGSSSLLMPTIVLTR